MAKLVFTDALVEEVLQAFACNPEASVPTVLLRAALAKASGKLEGSIRDRYVQLYQQYHDTSDDPTLPPSASRG